MKKKEGWTWLVNSRKWHYFVDGKALCGKFMLLHVGDLETGKDNSPDNCTGCKRKLVVRSEAGQQPVQG